MFATDDVAQERTIIQDERASHARAPHCVLALPLISPCIFDGGYMPEYTHP
jgi:hypothetical protein